MDGWIRRMDGRMVGLMEEVLRRLKKWYTEVIKCTHTHTLSA